MLRFECLMSDCWVEVTLLHPELDQRFPCSSSVPEQILSWHSNTACFTCSLPNVSLPFSSPSNVMNKNDSCLCAASTRTNGYYLGTFKTLSPHYKTIRMQWDSHCALPTRITADCKTEITLHQSHTVLQLIIRNKHFIRPDVIRRTKCINVQALSSPER
jgi:hypothetical protein